MRDTLDSQRYQAWLEHERGLFALEHCRGLLRSLLSSWPRRSRSALVLEAGSADFAEILWETGFDVTAQDSDPAFLEESRKRLHARAEFVLSSPEHLPFEDHAFDYVLAAAALEFCANPEAVLREMGRLACRGILLIVPNRWSLFALECFFRKKDPVCSAVRPLLQHPPSLANLCTRIYGKKPCAYASTLAMPSFFWKNYWYLHQCRSLALPLSLPVGAFVGLRFDFGSTYTGTPLILRTSEPVAPVR